ncbi:hypothetical protein AAE478_009153 [Parahypoxylon ruwenzoriense]
MSLSPRTALLVIDMQNFFRPMAGAALPHIENLVRHFKTKNLPITFTQHGHDDAELSGPPYRNQLVRKWGPDGSIHLGSHDWELLAPIKNLIRDELGGDTQVVSKNTYDAFINTDLEERLRMLKIDKVVVCGVMTDCCCDTTSRGAFDRGWETWLVRDACGSASKAQHEAGLKSFGYAFGDVVTTEEVINNI